ncbi:MAG: hypothetical protein ACREPZ_13665 [Rhodanobacteraceae bacterium]
MPPIRLADADAPLSGRLFRGLAYPLHGAALSGIVVLTLAHYLSLLPLAGWFFELLVWAGTYGYALECLRRTADGYAEPPEVTRETGVQGGWLLVALLLIALSATSLARWKFGAGAWWLTCAFALAIPAVVIALAFDDGLGAALNPFNWMRTMQRFGAPYFVLVLLQLIVGGVQGVAQDLYQSGASTVIELPLFYLLCTYATVLNFHWMGVMVWHYRERLGMRPEAPERAKASGQDADNDLVRECEALAPTDPEEAAIRLRDRIRERAAPASVHIQFRVLLRKLARNDLLLSHGQTWIAQCCASNDARRALSLVQECREIDPGFVPDDPDATATLARLAARLGMHDMAGHLARGFIARWPRHEAAQEVGGFAATAEAERTT